MVIQYNLEAFNANRMLGINSRKLAGSTEKMASGYKINRAADDAAGLSISEKMRKRIRGLERGMENVEDGISFCQVADGALDAATDLLQRARELSIQAYNGTNSKNDRHTIQEEIDQCFEEMDRIFGTTKFNETVIFKNGQRVQGAIYHDQSYTAKRTTTTSRNMPDWLKLNDGNDRKIGIHATYAAGDQVTNEIMKHDFKVGNDTIRVYFGPDKGNQGGYQWVGNLSKNVYDKLKKGVPGFDKYMQDHTVNGKYEGWTKEMTDNVSAKLDFSEFANITNADELYTKLGQLVGVEVGFPCGSCSRMEAVRFGGEFFGVDGVTFQDGHPSYVSKREINLSTKTFSFQPVDDKGNPIMVDGEPYGKSDYTGYFEAIVDVMSMSDTDENGNPTNKADLTEKLAKAIAEDLAKETYNSLRTSMTTHFDRAIMDSNDPYSVYVYDYRDADAIALTGTKADATIRTAGQVKMNYDELVTTGYYTHYDYWNAEQTWIQASDGTMDGMSIFSKRLSAELLKLRGYRIDTYAVDVTMDDPDEYKKKLDEWYAAAPEPIITPYTKEVIERVQVKPAEVQVIKHEEPEKNVGGEIIPARTWYEYKQIKPAEWKDQKVTKTFYKTEYPNDTRGPKPEATYTVTERYAPSDVKLLDDAIAAVCATRSYYGAVQNRLEHTYNNNYNADENITYAESRIRDTDMADETVRKSMLDILQQAGFSMLSQANQSKQGVSMLLS